MVDSSKYWEMWRIDSVHKGPEVPKTGKLFPPIVQKYCPLRQKRFLRANFRNLLVNSLLVSSYQKSKISISKRDCSRCSGERMLLSML